MLGRLLKAYYRQFESDFAVIKLASYLAPMCIATKTSIKSSLNLNYNNITHIPTHIQYYPKDRTHTLSIGSSTMQNTFQRIQLLGGSSTVNAIEGSSLENSVINYKPTKAHSDNQLTPLRREEDTSKSSKPLGVCPLEPNPFPPSSYHNYNFITRICAPSRSSSSDSTSQNEFGKLNSSISSDNHLPKPIGIRPLSRSQEFTNKWFPATSQSSIYSARSNSDSSDLEGMASDASQVSDTASPRSSMKLGERSKWATESTSSLTVQSSNIYSKDTAPTLKPTQNTGVNVPAHPQQSIPLDNQLHYAATNQERMRCTPVPLPTSIPTYSGAIGPMNTTSNMPGLQSVSNVPLSAAVPPPVAQIPIQHVQTIPSIYNTRNTRMPIESVKTESFSSKQGEYLIHFRDLALRSNNADNKIKTPSPKMKAKKANMNRVTKSSGSPKTENVAQTPRNRRKSSPASNVASDSEAPLDSIDSKSLSSDNITLTNNKYGKRPISDPAKLKQRIWLRQNRDYQQKLSLQGFKIIDTDDGFKQCSLCNKKYSKEMFVWRHSMKHVSEKPFHCDVCDQRFTRSDTLQRHIRRANHPYQITRAESQ